MQFALLASAGGIHRYTTDALCIPSRCVNPIFPALRALGQDLLAQQEEREWTCPDDQRARQYLDFCRDIVSYPFAVPVSGPTPLVGVAQAEDQKALKAYFQHLSGIGLEPWEFRSPQEDPCAASIARTVCFAHFPKCNVADNTAYLRPCETSCKEYISACGVECCDESVTCSWSKELVKQDGTTVVESAFIAHAAPSELCTGYQSSASRASLALVAALLTLRAPHGGLVALLALASLQGCAENTALYQMAQGDASSRLMGEHIVGAWRKQVDFSLKESYQKADGSLIFDSCSDPHVDTINVCSGRGVCEMWEQGNIRNPLGFCRCQNEWAGPECRTRRKSQIGAFVLSLFFGFLGLDMFYLELYKLGICKLLTCGGFGVWWLLDIVRTGVGPVYARNYRTASDLPTWAFVVVSVFVATLLGFLLFLRVLSKHLRRKRAPRDRLEVLPAGKSTQGHNTHLEHVAHLLEQASAQQGHLV